MPDGARLIPARAGFTPKPTRRPTSSPDHPRSRGVYCARVGGWVRVWGSSPLARGLQTVYGLSDIQSRIIPARAGFTLSITVSGASFGDHPRSRGVYLGVYRGVPVVGGSSPLARGLPNAVSIMNPYFRIIPARAGFTEDGACAECAHPDHPRSRGVYLAAVTSIFSPCGSSPLARGLLRSKMSTGSSPRIIPARAGFTPRWRARGRCRGDHPRSRGVYTCPASSAGSGRGSSPLARGLRPAPRGHPPRIRIIPARAGFTAGWCARCHALGDHPRSRGVYVPHGSCAAAGMGSSPLARGLRVQRE